MQSQEVIIRNKSGLHTRPAAIFVREASKFRSHIALSCEDICINGKSIMSLLMLALTPGTVVKLTAKGTDEEEAISTLSKILSGQFDA